MSEQVTPAPEPDNSAIRQIREHNKALEDALKAEKAAREGMEAKLQEIERGKMDELERVRLEKAELEKKAAELDQTRDSLGRFESKFKALYEQDLLAIPEEHRARAQVLASGTDWADSYERLQAVKGLLPAPGARVSAGTPTSPTLPTPTPIPPEPPKPLSPKDWGAIDLRDAMSLDKKAPADPASRLG